MPQIDMLAAGMRAEQDYASLRETTHSCSGENGGVGATIIKVLAVITGVFLLLAAATAPNPAVLLVALPVVVLVCALSIFYSAPIARFFATLAIFNASRRPPPRSYGREVHVHFGAPPRRDPPPPRARGWAFWRAAPPPPAAHGRGPGLARSYAAPPPFRAGGPPSSMSRSAFGGPTTPVRGEIRVAFEGGSSGGPTTFVGGERRTAFGGGSAAAHSTQVGAEERTAVGSRRHGDTSTTPVGGERRVAFGGAKRG